MPVRPALPVWGNRARRRLGRKIKRSSWTGRRFIEKVFRPFWLVFRSFPRT